MDEGKMGPIETLEILAPFLTKPLVTELCSGRKWADYRERKLQLLRQRIARAWARQRQLAKYHQQRETRFVDGVGQHKAVIDEELFAFTRSKYRRLAFHDPDNLNFILRKHPEFRVPAPKPRYHVVNGFRDARAGGAGCGARANPVTAPGALADRLAPAWRAGCAHELPAPPLLLPWKSQHAGET
jgi:hypothetical protein